MIIGTNWLLGFGHSTASQDHLIKERFADHKKIADVIEVFFRAGVDTIMGLIQRDGMYYGIQEAQNRTGVKAVVISTPGIPVDGTTLEKGFVNGEADRIFDLEIKRGATFCMPHTSTTDKLVDCCTRRIRRMDELCAKIRQRGMIPGLSTHMPEAIVYADETGLDVATYISLFNAMGFLMHIEVDWVARLIQRAKKPVMTIKPMAAGQIRPLQAFTFVWNAIRDIDMVTVGTFTPKEAEELIAISLAILGRRHADIKLQETRSKATIKPAKP
jgi:hypothetical protein